MPRSSTNRVSETAETLEEVNGVEVDEANVDEIGSPAYMPVETSKRNDRQMSKARVDENSFVSIMCIVDCNRNNEFAFRAGETMYVFTNIFEPKPMTVANFRVFAQTANGSAALRSKKIVVSGELPEDIIETLELHYKEKEIFDRTKYNMLFNYPVDNLKEMYDGLCDTHKEVVERLFMQGFYDNDNRVTKEKFEAMNEINHGKFNDVLRYFANAEIEKYKD